MIPDEDQRPVHPIAEPSGEENSARRPAFRIAVFVVFAIAIAGVTTWLSLRTQSPQPNTDQTQSNVVLPKFGKIPRLSISYRNLGAAAAQPISNFDITNGIPRAERADYDQTTRYEGNASLVLRSFNQKPDTHAVAGHFDFSRMQVFDAMVKASDPGSVESFVVRFRSRTSTAAFEYPVSLSGTGWTPIRMMRAQFASTGGAVPSTWADIGFVEIILVSRPGLDAQVNVDLLRAEEDAELRYADAWSVADGKMLGVISTRGGTALLFRNLVTGSLGALQEVADTKDFSLTVELSPVTTGRGGLFFRGNVLTGSGFTFMIDGIGGHQWELLRTKGGVTSVLSEGAIQITSFVPIESYWLRAEMRGSRIEVSLSLDGTAFVTVASVTDDTFAFGQLGVAAYDGAAYAIHEIDYQRL